MEVYETGFRPPKQNTVTEWHEYTSRLRPPPTFLGLCASSWTLLAAERRKSVDTAEGRGLESPTNEPR
jgi:hypothetical protein